VRVRASGVGVDGGYRQTFSVYLHGNGRRPGSSHARFILSIYDIDCGAQSMRQHGVIAGGIMEIINVLA